MRKLKFLLVVVTVVVFTNIVKGQGIEFHKGNLTSALEKAKKENKLVFVDVYTKWCGPCKTMSKNVFPQKEAGDYFNKMFVNVKIDAEAGEGPLVSETFQVTSLPTLLFINQDGSLIKKVSGASPNAAFLVNTAKLALGKIENFLDKYKEFEKGKKDLDFVQSLLTEGGVYAVSLGDEDKMNLWYEKLGNIAKDYLEQKLEKMPEQLINKKDFNIINENYDGPYNGLPIVEFVYQNYEAYKKILNLDDLTNFVARTNNRSIHDCANNGDTKFREYVEDIKGKLKKAHIDIDNSPECTGDSYLVMKYCSESSYALTKGNYSEAIDWGEKYLEYIVKVNKQVAVDGYWIMFSGILEVGKDKLSKEEANRCVENMEIALKLAPKNADVNLIYGIALKCNGEIDAAKKVLKAVLAQVKGTPREEFFKEDIGKHFKSLEF